MSSLSRTTSLTNLPRIYEEPIVTENRVENLLAASKEVKEQFKIDILNQLANPRIVPRNVSEPQELIDARTEYHAKIDSLKHLISSDEETYKMRAKEITKDFVEKTRDLQVSHMQRVVALLPKASVDRDTIHQLYDLYFRVHQSIYSSAPAPQNLEALELAMNSGTGFYPIDQIALSAIRTYHEKNSSD